MANNNYNHLNINKEAGKNKILYKILSIILFLFKFLLSIVVITLLPLIVFIFFIFLEPREVPKLNDYLLEKLTQSKDIESITFKQALLSLDKKFRVNYTIKDLKIRFTNKTKLNIPNIDISVDIINFFKKEYIINSIILKNIYVSTKSKNFEKIEHNDATNKDFLKDVYDIANYINKKNIPLKNIIIKDSRIKFDNTKNDVNYILINFDKFKDNKVINMLMSININQNAKKLITNNSCKFYIDKTVECNINIKDFSTNNLSELYNNELQYSEYINNIKTNLNGNAYMKFSNYTHLEYGNFDIKAENGNLNLKDVFGDVIDFKLLEINGEFSNNFKNVRINNFNIDIIDNNYNSNIKLLLDISENNILLDIFLNNIDINKTNTFWPVFLSQNSIREWVIEHVKDGYIDNAFAKMKFDKVNNTFVFSDIYSEVFIKKSYLDIYETIPIIKDLDVKAIFTKNDMNIYINSGKFNNTELKNGLVYSDFNAKNSILDIKAKSNGLVYELFYFIDKNYEDIIKNNVKKYINGKGEADINVKIDLDKDMDLEDFFIKADVKVKNNSSIILKNNLDIKLNKNFNSKTFNVDLDLKDTQINFPFLTLDKKVGELEKINLDVIIQDNNDIYITNFVNNDKNYLDLIGNILIKNGEIVDFELKSVYEVNDFTFEYSFSDVVNLSIYGNSLLINNNNLKKDYKNLKYLFFDTDSNNDKINLNINTDLKTLFYNKEFRNLTSNISIKDNIFLNSNLRVEYGDKEHINVNVQNTGKKYSKLKLHVRDIGKLIRYFGVTENIMGGKLNYIGQIDNNFNLKGNLIITQGIDIIKTDRNTKNIRKILESKFIPQKTKDAIKNKSTINFSELDSYIEINNGVITIKDLICFGKLVGLDITGRGNFYIKNGTFDIKGLIIPAGAINRLLIVDKIPILNSIILGEKNGGLFAIDYYAKKVSQNSEVEFVINKSSVLTPGPIRGMINRVKNIIE